MNLYAEGLDVVGTVGTSGKIGEIELDLIPAVVQPHRHRADEGLHPGRALVVARPKSSSHVLVVKHLHLEREVFFQVFDDHDEEGELDAEGFARVGGAGDVGRTHVGSDDLQNQRLNVVVSDSLYVAIPYLFVPDL